MHEATFQVEGQGEFADITRGVDASVELWCNNHCDLLGITGDSNQTLHTRIEDLTGIQDSIAQDNSEILITKNCLEEFEATLVDTYISRYNCLMLPPLRYERGYKTCRVLALDSQQLTDFYRDISGQTNVEVESKREINGLVQDSPLFTVEDAIPDFSDRQREVLIRAQEEGYYKIPRETTTEEIAEKMGVTRRTVETHLRRAENKLVDTLIDFIAHT